MDVAAIADPIADLLADRPWRPIGALRYQTLERPHALLVRYAGQVADIATAEQWFEQLDAELEQLDLTQILWDSRQADPHPPEVRTRIWRWLEEARVLARSAIVVESEMLRISANLSAVGGKLQIKAFHRLDEAEDWLQRALPAARAAGRT